MLPAVAAIERGMYPGERGEPGSAFSSSAAPREDDDEFRPTARVAEADPAAVGLDDPAADRQAQAGPLVLVVENASNNRGACAGATPGPLSCTEIRNAGRPCSSSPLQRMAMSTGSGQADSALSSRLRKTCFIRNASTRQRVFPASTCSRSRVARPLRSGSMSIQAALQTTATSIGCRSSRIAVA